MPAKKKEDKSGGDKGAPPEEKFQQLDISTKDVRTAVVMLDTPETSVICKACQSIQTYMEKSDQNCLEIHGLNIIPRLVHLISSPERAIIAHAMLCLAVMVPHLAVRRSLLKLPCIQPLLVLLKPDEEVVILERVTFIISQLAEEYTYKQQLEESKVCPLLITLLSHSDCDVIKNCIKSLSLMSNYHKSRLSINEGNGFPALLSLLNSEYAIIQELSLQTLHNTLQDIQCRASFQKVDGLARLIDFLSNKEWDDLHVLAVTVLSLCLLEEGGMDALHSSDCLQRLLACINESQIPKMKNNATLALARAASDPMCCKMLHEQDAEKVFISLLTSSDESVLTAACQALGALSSLTTSRQRVGKEGGIKGLVQLLQNTNSTVRSAAVHALSFEINDTAANGILVSELGGLDPLVSLLSDELATTRVHAISCIISLSPNGSIRSELIDNNVMSGLVNCLSHSDVHIQQISLEAIALLTVDCTAREQFPVDEVECLLQLLVSSNSEVSRCAAWAVSGLALNKQIADRIFKNKGLDTLQHLSQSSHKMIQKYSQLALTRLLAGCPAAQYHVTGHLTSLSNLTGNEFWDMGMAEGKKGFVPLQELLNEPPNLNRPIITVSLINQPVPVPNEEVVTSEREESTLDVRSLDVSAKSRASSKIKKNKSEKIEEPPTTGQGDTSEPHPLEGLLPPDATLWDHMTYVQQNIQPLHSIQDQAERLAVYVSQVMGGAVGRSTSIHYELPMSEVQSTDGRSLVPLGSISKGSFQHRSLLYKVLADSIGLPCTLTRGNYGRYWNTVLVNGKGGEEYLLIDLMYTPGQLMNELQAKQYMSL